MSNKRLTIEEMRSIATNRGGKCHSLEYTNNKTPLLWECCQGHQWLARPYNIKCKGSWCPLCIINVGEELVRATCEEAFYGKKFIRTRSIPRLHGLELDGYCESEQLAFEYQGIQHVEHIPLFHKTKKDFESQLARDAYKLEACMELEINLLLVPHTIPYKDIRREVRKLLVEDVGYDEKYLAPMTLSDAEFFDKIRSGADYILAKFATAKEIIEKKGGVCLSTTYVGYKIPMQIQCKAGHTFMSSLEAISRVDGDAPRFCPDCGGKRLLTEQKCEDAAKARGYVYLGRDREIDNTPEEKRRWRLFLKCPVGHNWSPTWDNFNAGKNCSICRKVACGDSRRLGESTLNARLSVGNITLVDPIYKNQDELHTWRCANGHNFVDTFATLKHRLYSSPCMICKYNDDSQKFGMQLIAQAVYGKKGSSLWPWQCNLCGQTDIIAAKKDVSVNNMGALCKKGTSLLGKAIAHPCPMAPVDTPTTKPKRIVKVTPLQCQAVTPSQEIAQKGINLVSDEYKGVYYEHMWTCQQKHVFVVSWKTLKKRKNPCVVCWKNSEGASYGWCTTPQPIYYEPSKNWTHDCLLCGQKNIAAKHESMKCSNHSANIKRGTSLLGKAAAHPCCNLRGLPYSAAVTLLVCKARVGLPVNIIHRIVYLLSHFDPLGRPY